MGTSLTCACGTPALAVEIDTERLLVRVHPHSEAVAALDTKIAAVAPSSAADARAAARCLAQEEM